MSPIYAHVRAAFMPFAINPSSLEINIEILFVNLMAARLLRVLNAYYLNALWRCIISVY
jgi:hypothetical protein